MNLLKPETDPLDFLLDPLHQTLSSVLNLILIRLAVQIKVFNIFELLTVDFFQALNALFYYVFSLVYLVLDL